MAAEQKRYYWLKLQRDFFGSKRIKKLRRLAGGDTFTIIYLKMQLKALTTGGVLTWSGLEDDFASELALDLDEEPDNVAVTLQFLLAHKLIETEDGKSFLLPYVLENTGSETASTQRWRDWKQRQTLESNANMLESNRKALDSNMSPTNANTLPTRRQQTPTLCQQITNVEKELKKEEEEETDTARARNQRAEDQDAGFYTFWAAFPRRSGEIRDAYLEYIHALDTGATLETILEALSWQAEEWAGEEARYIPSPQKWLQNRRWEEPRRKKKQPNGLAAELTPVGTVDLSGLESVLNNI